MKLNTIIIPFEVIRKNYIEHGIKPSDCIVDNFIFDEFRMIFNLVDIKKNKHEMKLSVKFLPETNNRNHIFSSALVQSDCDGLQDEFQWIFGDTWNHIVCVSIPPGRPEPKPNDRVTKVSIIIFACHYIMTSNRKRIASEKSIVHEKKEQTESTNQRKKRIYLLNEIIEYVNEQGLGVQPQKTGRTIDCDCWSVRGHYRHYKNGKTIFIKSYLKGKKRDSTKPKAKEYYV